MSFGRGWTVREPVGRARAAEHVSFWRRGRQETYKGDKVVEEMRLSDSHTRQTLMFDMHHMHVKVICPRVSVPHLHGCK